MNYLYIDNNRVAQIISLVSTRVPRKIVSQALDGTVYVQTIGPGRSTANVSVFVSNKVERESMDEAACNGNTIICEHNGRVHIGYIEEGITWRTDRYGYRGVGSFRLLLDEEVE